MENDHLAVIRDAVHDAFTAEAGSKLYVNLERVPLLCQSVMGIQDMLKEQRGDLKEIKQSMNDWEDNYVTQKEFSIIRNIVFGGIAIILTGLLVVALVKIIPDFRLN